MNCASAQTTPSSSPDNPQVLAPVTVYATEPTDYRAKESQAGALGDLPLLSTPYSINVISRDLLVNQQAAYLGDFLKNDPSATVGNVVVSFANLRGFSVGNDGFQLDGLALGPLLNDGRVALSSFDRVEILKGASAFMYGLGASTSLGGTINYVPKIAPQTPVRELSATYNSTSNLGMGVDLGDRFGAERQFGYRVNLGFRGGDVAVDDMAWQQGNGSIALDWRASRDLVFSGGLYNVDNKFRNIQPFFIGATDAGGAPIVPIPRPSDARHNIGPSWSRFEQEATIGWGRADWSFSPDWTLTVQYGGGRNDRPNSGTQDTRFGTITSGAGDAMLFVSEERSRTDVQAGQALVHGKFTTGSLGHQVTFGASGSEQKSYSLFNIVNFVPVNLNTTSTATQPAYAPLDGLPYTGKTTSRGALVSDIVSFNEQWSVLLGGRQSKVTTYDATNAQIPGGEISKFSPTAGLMFKPVPAALLYANYAQGLEPGGTAPVGAANVGAIMAPLVTRQYEIGAKVETTRLTLTAAVFDMRKPLQFLDGSGTYAQSGEQVHQGVELLAAGRLTPDLRIVAGTMYLEAKQENTGSAATNGMRVPGVPQWTANAFLDYRLGAVPGLYLNAGVYYNDRQAVDLANLQSIPSWTRFDVGARYETKLGAQKTTFLLAVENVADRSYWASALGQALTLGDPLTVKATMRVAF